MPATKGAVAMGEKSPGKYGFEENPIGFFHGINNIPVYRCKKCQSLVDGDCLQDHNEWHILLGERLRYVASLSGHAIGRVNI